MCILVKLGKVFETEWCMRMTAGTFAPKVWWNWPLLSEREREWQKQFVWKKSQHCCCARWQFEERNIISRDLFFNELFSFSFNFVENWDYLPERDVLKTELHLLKLPLDSWGKWIKVTDKLMMHSCLFSKSTRKVIFYLQK